MSGAVRTRTLARFRETAAARHRYCRTLERCSPAAANDAFVRRIPCVAPARPVGPGLARVVAETLPGCLDRQLAIHQPWVRTRVLGQRRLARWGGAILSFFLYLLAPAMLPSE